MSLKIWISLELCVNSSREGGRAQAYHFTGEPDLWEIGVDVELGVGGTVSVGRPVRGLSICC